MASATSTSGGCVGAYDAVNNFWQLHEDEVVQFEILPPAIRPTNGLLLQDGIHLGVPKEVLAIAFLEARQRFLLGWQDPRVSLHALQATRVMLLCNSEHVTAANYRKRALISVEERDGPLCFLEALKKELCFLDSILTSPLHRQSKSPTLWHHRLWILDPLTHLLFQGASTFEKAIFWRSEVESVCKSGNHHPKNYYAWQYARRLMPRIDDDDVNLTFVEIVMDWCFRNPGDISGWTFFAYLASSLHPFAARESIFGQVLEYYYKLHIASDSAWVFMRMIVSQENVPEERSKFLELITKSQNGIAISTGSPAFLQRVSHTLEWIHKSR